MTLSNEYRERRREVSQEFAVTILAARNRFYYSKDHNAFLRISSLDEERDLFQIEICPLNRIRDVTNYWRGIGDYQRNKEYFLWRENPELEEETLSALKIPKKTYLDYESLVVNRDGEVVK